MLISHQEIGAAYPAVLDRMRERKEDYVTAEREVIGFSHPLIGALVAWKWGFPHSTCRAILHYSDPLDKISGEEDEKLGMLKLATVIGLASGIGRPDGCAVEMETELHRLAAHRESR